MAIITSAITTIAITMMDSEEIASAKSLCVGADVGEGEAEGERLGDGVGLGESAGEVDVDGVEIGVGEGVGEETVNVIVLEFIVVPSESMILQ